VFGGNSGRPHITMLKFLSEVVVEKELDAFRNVPVLLAKFLE